MREEFKMRIRYKIALLSIVLITASASSANAQSRPTLLESLLKF